MPEQPQWSERTLDMPPQDPWADPPTAPVPPPPPPPGPAPAADTQVGPDLQVGPDNQPFSRGRAQVNAHPRTSQFAAEHEPTGTGWPGAEAPRRPIGWHARELRRGGEWSTWPAVFAFVCWGIWAISTEGAVATKIVVFVLSLIVAAGLFALCRALGRVVLEKQFHRVRRGAKVSHMITGVFLVGVGLAHLRQTPWVVDAYNWIVGVSS